MNASLTPLRNALERTNSELLRQRGEHTPYEAFRIRFDSGRRTYTPDFILANGIIIETKGYFRPEDREKHLTIRSEHPDLDVRFVFSNAQNRLSQFATDTYADWCHEHGFQFGVHTVPVLWQMEGGGKKRIDALAKAAGNGAER
jgi:hypothetical protein